MTIFGLYDWRVFLWVVGIVFGISLSLREAIPSWQYLLEAKERITFAFSFERDQTNHTLEDESVDVRSSGRYVRIDSQNGSCSKMFHLCFSQQTTRSFQSLKWSLITSHLNRQDTYVRQIDHRMMEWKFVLIRTTFGWSRMIFWWCWVLGPLSVFRKYLFKREIVKGHSRSLTG